MQNCSFQVLSFLCQSAVLVFHLDGDNFLHIYFNCIPQVTSRLNRMPFNFTNVNLVTLIHMAIRPESYKLQVWILLTRTNKRCFVCLLSISEGFCLAAVGGEGEMASCYPVRVEQSASHGTRPSSTIHFIKCFAFSSHLFSSGMQP